MDRVDLPVVLDAEGRVARISHEACVRLDLNPSEVLGLPGNDLAQKLNPSPSHDFPTLVSACQSRAELAEVLRQLAPAPASGGAAIYDMVGDFLVLLAAWPGGCPLPAILRAREVWALRLGREMAHSPGGLPLGFGLAPAGWWSAAPLISGEVVGLAVAWSESERPSQPASTSLLAITLARLPAVEEWPSTRLNSALVRGDDARPGTAIMANIRDIEGVGDGYAAKLEEAGVNSVEKLLEAGATKKGREELAEKTGVSEKHILRWVNHADLCRIKGVGPQFSELLEAAGVDSVPELAQRNAANLAAKMEEVNNEKNLTGRVPTADQLQAMIDEAKTLERVVSH